MDYNFHCLRHTFAVRRYAETRDIYRVMKDLGHTNVLTTQIYANFSSKRLEQDFPTLSKVSKIRHLETKKVETNHTYSNVARLWN